MSNNYKIYLRTKNIQGARFGTSSLLFCGLLFLLLFSSIGVVAQATVTPSYEWDSYKDLTNVKPRFIIYPPSVVVNSEDVIISIATDPLGNVYTLSLGKGVDKRDSSGKLIKAEFISASKLDNPLDIAIDKEGLIYIADYFAGGTTFADNGKIWVFDSNGILRSDKTILTSFFRPMGIDVDDENVYIAEYNDGNQGPEKKQYSRLEVVNKFNSALRISIDDIGGASYPKVPYRIAVDSQKRIFVSQAGNNNPQVLVFDSDLKNPSPLPNILSAGSVVVDKFDFIHVLEYDNRVDFEKFINYENLGTTDVLNLYNDIKNGIAANAFSIKIFDKNKVLVKTISDNNSNQFNIEFPFDIAFNLCDKMYTNNINTVGAAELDFDLEIYNRKPSFDTEKPVIISCVPDQNITLTNGQFVLLDYSSLAVFSASDLCDQNLTITQIPAIGTAISQTTEVSITATDDAGNVSDKCIFKIIVANNTDSEKPVFTSCPSNIPKNVDSGKCGAVVTFATPTATDNSGEVPTITRVDNNLSLTSGSLFPVGSTLITYRATDASGNFSECSFTILVSDNEKPVVSCPASISETVAFGTTGKIINYTAPTFTDNCPGSNITQTAGQASGSEFPIGATTNTFLITDASGNTQTCSFTVTITESSDSEKPVFTPCSGNISKNVDSGKCGAVVTFSTPTATDNSGETPTITRVDNNLSLTSGSLFPVGSTQIVYRATDASGNFSECSFTILVSDNEKPTFECPENVTANFEASEGYSVPDYSTLFPASDNCDSNLIYTQNPSANTVITEAGDYQITLSAKDATGNVGTCSFVLMLTKSDTFLLSCNGFFNLEADQNCKFIMPDLSSEYSIQPSAASVSQSIPAGQEINADTNVTIKATYNGEVQTCVIKVTQVDYKYPEIQNCPQAQTITLGNNEFYTIPDFTLIASATDNCEIQIFTQNLTVGNQINQSEQVVLSATDNFGNTTTCAFNLIINNTNPVNQAPVANNNTFSTNMDTLLNIPALGVLANDTDAENDELTAILQTSTANGNLTLNSDGSFTYTPNTGFTGEDTFTYVANDGTENSNTATVIIKVNPINPTNTAPNSVNDIYSTLQNVSLTVPANNGVLSNDSDAEGDQLTVTLLTDVSFGTLTLNPDGSFVYIPFADFSGADFFTYSATDGSLNSNISTARIEVVAVSDNTVTCKEAISLELDANGNASLNAGDLFTTRPVDLQFSVSKALFTCADLGENLITLSYNNSSIQGSCQIKVIIVDAMAPVINVKPITVALNNFGSVTITPEMLDNGTTDNCSELSFSLSKNKFGCKELGENTVIFNATDSSGNISRSSVLITVTGNCEIEPEVGVEYIFIYPNPTSGPFQFATPTGVSIDRVEAFDFRGRMIMFKDFSAGELQYAMDLSGVQNAVYILKLYTSEGISIIRVIIN